MALSIEEMRQNLRSVKQATPAPTAPPTQPVETTGTPDLASRLSSRLGRELPKPEVKKPPGIFSRTMGFLKETAVETGRRFVEAGKAPTFAEAGLRAAGAVARGVGEVAGAAAIGAAKVALPKSAEEAIAKSFQEGIAKSDIPKIMESYESWKAANPRAAENLEATVDIASIIPVGRIAKVGVSQAVKAAAPIVGKMATVGARGVEKAVVKQLEKEALDIIASKITKKEATEAIAKGRKALVSPTQRLLPKPLQTVRLAPSPDDIEIARSVSDVVKKGKRFDENIQAINKKIANSAKNVETTLETNNAIYNKNQMRSFLDKTKKEVKEGIMFAGDANLEKTYDDIVGSFMTHLDKQPKNLAGAWKARIAFDKMVKEQFPKAFSTDPGYNVRKHAIRDIRRAANDFIESKLPEGAQYKTELREMSKMYDAIDNIAANEAGTLNRNLVSRAAEALKTSTTLQAVTFAGIGTATSLLNIVSSPAVIGALVLGGTYKLGKKVITSKMLKSALAKALREIEKPRAGVAAEVAASIAEQQAALQAIHDSLPD